MAITYVDDGLGGTTTTTSFTIVVPAAAALGDLMVLEFCHRGTGDGTVSDNSGDGVSWTRKGEALFASGTFTVQHYYKRVTAAMVGGGDTITVTGLTNACAGIVNLYRGALASGDPFEAWTAEANASGDESHAAITTLTDGSWVVLTVGNSPDLAVSTQSTTSPGALTERAEVLSTGGTDASIAHASAEKASAGSTGALTWAQTNAASGTLAYAIEPEPTPTQTAVAEVDLAAGTEPDTRTNHSIQARARVTSGAGTLRAALYEGATNRSGDLESGALTTSLADYTLPIADASAANITDYSNLSIRFHGYAAGGGAIVFEIDQLWLKAPEGSGPSTQEITPGRVDRTRQIFAPTITTGAVSITITNRMDRSRSIFAPTITTVVNVTLGRIDRSRVIFAVTVNVQPVTITLARVDRTRQIFDPTISAGGATQTVSLDARLDRTRTIFAPTVTRGAVTITPARVDRTRQIFAPTLTFGAVTVSLSGRLDRSRTIFAPTVTAQATGISLARVDRTRSIFAPTFTTGLVTITLPGGLEHQRAIFLPIVGEPPEPGVFQPRIGFKDMDWGEPDES